MDAFKWYFWIINKNRKKIFVIKTVIMICGLGSAGKSTLTKILKEKYFNNAKICSVDYFTCNGYNIKEGVKEWTRQVKESFLEYETIILDYCLDSLESRKKFLKSFNFPKNINFICLYLDTSPQKIIEHNFKRNPAYELNEHEVNKIYKYYYNQEFPNETEFKQFSNSKIFIIKDNNYELLFKNLNKKKELTIK